MLDDTVNMDLKFPQWSIFHHYCSDTGNCYFIVVICLQFFFFFFWVRAIRHPASGYVQGINDLVTPFLVVFLSEYLEGSVDDWSIANITAEKISDIEADCYWCLSKLLDGMQDHYTFAQPGIQRLVFKLKELVRRIDGKPLLRPLVPPINISHI